MSKGTHLLPVWLLLGVTLPVAVVASSQPLFAQEESAPESSCSSCHSQLDGSLGDGARVYAEDIHAVRGLNCAACHGGDPGQAEPDKAMDPRQGYIGTPSRARIPPLCARCHSDTTLMRTYNPRLRTDQLAQYKTSVHGQRLSRGDTNVAVCTDCHSVHNIRPSSSPLSSVYPLNIPETCGRCHTDAERMKSYGIGTDQLEEYQQSKHFATLQDGDLAAPTCATCHGNHGAVPPGVESVERVCGTCHVFQEQLFDQSPHKEGFEMMGFSSCQTCHSNHAILPTHDGLIGTGEDAFCVNCHFEGEDNNGWEGAERIHTALTGLDAKIAEATALLDRAERAGMGVSEARLTQAQAHEKLVKARVDVHSFNPAKIEETVAGGLELAEEVFAAGVEAMQENAFRRKGLAASLFVIAFVVLSLVLLIRRIEHPPPPAE